MSATPTLIHILTANRWGGIQRYALDICREFKEAGWDVYAITKGAKAVDDLFEREGISLLYAPFEGMLDFQSIRLLKQKIEKCEGRVVVHAHGFRKVFTALAARKLSKKGDVRVVVTRHKVKRGNDSWLFREIYNHIDAIVFVSRLARDKFIETWKGRELPFPAGKMHVLHNSIKMEETVAGAEERQEPRDKIQEQCRDVPQVHPPQRGSKNDEPSDKSHGPGLEISENRSAKKNRGPVTAMFHGPLESGKGLETLIDAMSLLKGKKIRLRIVGSGTPDYVDKIRRRAISRGVMDLIDWHKYTDNPLVLISESDFGVLPSLDAEAFGLSNIEYMSMGRPQVCSSNGAQTEYITDGVEGILVPPGNAELLAAAIEELATDPELRHRMGRKAYETFRERLSWDRFVKGIGRIYGVGATEGGNS